MPTSWPGSADRPACTALAAGEEKFSPPSLGVWRGLAAPVNLLSSVKELVFLPAGPPTSLGFP